MYSRHMGFLGGSDGEESTSNGDPVSIPGSGRSPREGNGNPLQNLCLETPMDRGAWRAIVHGLTKSRTRLSNSHCEYEYFCLFVCCLVWCSCLKCLRSNVKFRCKLKSSYEYILFNCLHLHGEEGRKAERLGLL